MTCSRKNWEAHNLSMISERAQFLHGFTFSELRHSEGLYRLDQTFLTALLRAHPEWHEKLLAYRHAETAHNPIETSDLLINCATFLETFLAAFFDIEEAAAIAQAKTTSLNPISTFKKYFVLRRAKKELRNIDKFPPFATLNQWLEDALKKAAIQADDKELAIALLGTQYLADQESNRENIEKLAQWCARALSDPEGQSITKEWTSFHLPERLDYDHLVPTEVTDKFGCEQKSINNDQLRLRDGFKLTDPRMNAREVQDEVNYCIYCHDHDGDFCSKGFPVKKGDPAQGFKRNPLDVTLTGCPLEEKISEMHYLKRDGYTLGALAMVMIDNPMCPATGHRICNDCMKACIYQKQDPVNIPQIETRVLTDVLDLPWGVEIYDLLTRWNPLRRTQWAMKPYNGLKVMIAGMGPAGFTLAHHLLLEGFAVVGFDGLKIEPLPEKLIHEPIRQYSDLRESLDERLMAGFGGVAEYGITVRWDKNFLKLIYLSLMRRPYFQVFGGVRFGGTLQIEDAWHLGFDHFVVAVGAGLPKALPIPHSMAPGMRQANDFLMALQLGNAAKRDSLTNLQIRLPAVVIGGGLTGVDTATEVQAYYIAQVEKTLDRYETLANTLGKEKIHEQLDPASASILDEFLQHGLLVRQERERAREKREQPNFIKLIHTWGGVTIAYRRSLQESPAYINNHEELKKAFEEGIYYIEGLEPTAVELDAYGHSSSLVCRKRLQDSEKTWQTTSTEVRLPARSILVATGTQPNTAYEFEYRGTFHRLNLQYQHYEDEQGELSVAHGVEHCKDPDFGPFTSYSKDDKRISLIGDTHPVFHGSVVKAIASGMRTYPKILATLKNRLEQRGNEAEYQRFAENMSALFQAQVIRVVRKADHVIELTIKAPQAAKHYKTGQFYRLQNFETFAPKTDHTLLQIEPIALVTAEHNEQQDTLTFIVTENSAATKLCATLKPGDPVSLMGPTGVRAKIPTEHESVLIIGNASSFAFTRSYGPKLRATGNHVYYFCQLDNNNELYCREEIEKAVDRLSITNDKQNLLQHLIASGIPLADIDRIYIVGDTSLLRQFQAARKTILKNHLLKDPKVVGSVYGNMQCMLKGVCAQCLQWQIDPETGRRTKAVFACSWQDQPLELVDIDHIDERRMQNHLSDVLSGLWVDYLFKQYTVPRI